MINARSAKKFCCEDVSLIENYEEAIADTATWHIHHRRELNPDGKFAYSSEELIKMGMYYKRPASELIFLTESEHLSLHRKGKKLSDETKQKLSDANKGHNNSFYGKTHSDETRAKISAALKGMTLSAEHRAKLSAAQQGKKRSEETKAKISAALKGRKLSDETKAKISAAQIGNTYAKGSKGKKRSDEAKSKISAAKKILAEQKKEKEMYRNSTSLSY